MFDVRCAHARRPQTTSTGSIPEEQHVQRGDSRWVRQPCHVSGVAASGIDEPHQDNERAEASSVSTRNDLEHVESEIHGQTCRLYHQAQCWMWTQWGMIGS